MAERKPKDQREADDERQKEFDRFDNLAQPFEQFEDLARKLFRVPKEEVDEQRRKYEQEREKKRAD
jgi:hypothetical protein